MSLKGEVHSSTGLTCSVGVAPVKFLAKIVSDWRKPDGLFILTPEEVPEFMTFLPVKKIPGVGKVFQKELAKFNITYAGDLFAYTEEWLQTQFGRRGPDLLRRARGEGSTTVETNRAIKSTSCENTFAKDISDKKQLKKWIMDQSERVGADLRRHGLAARTITLKLKYSDFTTITRSHTLPEATSATRTIYQTAAKLLSGVTLKKPARLIGVGASSLEKAQRQLSLFHTEETRENKLDSALDALRRKHGGSIIKRGPSLDED